MAFIARCTRAWSSPRAEYRQFIALKKSILYYGFTHGYSYCTAVSAIWHYIYCTYSTNVETGYSYPLYACVSPLYVHVLPYGCNVNFVLVTSDPSKATAEDRGIKFDFLANHFRGSFMWFWWLWLLCVFHGCSVSNLSTSSPNTRGNSGGLWVKV